jgi:probable HAF family extracellular repeat protein
MLSGGWAQRLVWLGQLPGGLESEALGVSADGTVVVGTAINSDGFRRAFRWTESDGMQDLGTLGGVLSIGNAISADGQTIVGYSSNQRGELVAFRWRNGQMTALGTLSSVVWGEAYGVSADGAVISGHSWWGSNFRAARWQGNTVTNLGTLPGAIASRAWGVSGEWAGDCRRGVFRKFRLARSARRALAGHNDPATGRAGRLPSQLGVRRLA